MSFRIEEKIIFNDSDLLSFRHFLQNKNVTKIYPKRLISSLYFDNSSFQAYEDSEEGILPRKKIRIRFYPDQKKISYSLEIKTSSIEGRYKTTDHIKGSKYDQYLKFGIINDTYGIVLPAVNVSYIREYYSLNNFRITIDTKIIYKTHLSKKLINEKVNVVEIKASYLEDPDILLSIIPYNRSRFSKYSNAIKSLGLFR